MRAISGLFFALVLAFFTAPTAFAGPPFPLRANLQFGPESPYAMVVFEAEPDTVLPSWKLDLLAFDPASRTWTYGMLNGWSQFEDIRAGATGRQFYAALVRPAGVYAVNSISASGFWVGCFNGGTKAFTLQAGHVNYIGLIDPNPTLTEIRDGLPNRSRGGAHLFLFDTPRLHLTPASARENWEAALRTFLSSTFPHVNAPLVAPEPLDVTFEPGHSFTGQICEKY